MKALAGVATAFLVSVVKKNPHILPTLNPPPVVVLVQVVPTPVRVRDYTAWDVHLNQLVA